ncbi:hypothetical protein [Thalassomonas sp. RHCl1]|uniref:hypothetical protein n=1 Tax=Thalassomonas sp. RHCl1 TaxID=2995320 RepID=UPI00248D2DAA|nr:hypothetical protein [Thalassomonas sp. RHCl1]
MADSRKLPKELAEQIQTIAGSVYVQVEEELTTLLAGQVPPEIKIADISREQLAQHPDYQVLETQISSLKEQVASLEATYDDLADSSKKALLDQKQDQKLEQEKDQEQLQAVLEQQKQTIASLEISEGKLSKDNAAKAATLDIQNKQISSLQQELNETASELERVKSDARQESESAREQQEAQQQQVAELSQINHMLNKQLAQTQSELDLAVSTAGQDKLSAKEQQQALQQELFELSKSNNKITGDLQLKAAELKKLQSVLTNKDSVIKQFTVEAEALQAEKRQQSQLIAEREEQLQQQAGEIEQMLKDAGQREQVLKENLGKADARLGSQQEELAGLRKKLQSEQDKWALQLSDGQSKQEELIAKLKQSDEQVSQYQQQCDELEQKVSGLNNTLKKAEQRLEKNREKFQADGDKARETIKYLRDENFELNSRLETELGELESKLTEYRLRFEYAQKQLEKN